MLRQWLYSHPSLITEHMLFPLKPPTSHKTKGVLVIILFTTPFSKKKKYWKISHYFALIKANRSIWRKHPP